MSLWVPLTVAALLFAVAYRVYGGFLARAFRLDPQAPTPAETLRDDVDYIPTEPKFLLGQHFSAIAAAGPIVGPILAGAMFGWLPAFLWIPIGAIFIGGFHDMASLVASIRHKARSIADVVQENMSRRSYLVFLGFIWLALVYIIVAFADITASSFVGVQKLENGQELPGAAIATSSLLYLILPVLMGLALKFTKISLAWATVIFVPLVGLAIWVGPLMPFDLASILQVETLTAQKIWVGLIVVYCVAAAMAPMWILLQPRGHLGGIFLYFFLIVGVLGLFMGGQSIQFPAFTSWTQANGDTLAPFLFITIACGAVSGFHSLIASGTTSKQLRRETDAKPIGYGTMLLEGLVAILALSCVMMLAQGDPALNGAPNMIFAHGIGGFLASAGIPLQIAIAVMLMAFTTFVYDTLDVCTRLGRYIIQELTGWKDRRGAFVGTALTALVPLFFVWQTAPGPGGAVQPAWRVFWGLFGASNQLLAALTLLGVTVWLWKTERARWALFAAGVPCVLMYAMSCWALVIQIQRALKAPEIPDVVAMVAAILIALAGLMLVEAIRAFGRGGPRGPVLAPSPTA